MPCDDHDQYVDPTMICMLADVLPVAPAPQKRPTGDHKVRHGAIETENLNNRIPFHPMDNDIDLQLNRESNYKS